MRSYVLTAAMLQRPDDLPNGVTLPIHVGDLFTPRAEFTPRQLRDVLGSGILPMQVVLLAAVNLHVGSLASSPVGAVQSLLETAIAAVDGVLTESTAVIVADAVQRQRREKLAISPHAALANIANLLVRLVRRQIVNPQQCVTTLIQLARVNSQESAMQQCAISLCAALRRSLIGQRREVSLDAFLEQLAGRQVRHNRVRLNCKVPELSQDTVFQAAVTSPTADQRMGFVHGGGYTRVYGPGEWYSIAGPLLMAITHTGSGNVFCDRYEILDGGEGTTDATSSGAGSIE